MTVNDKGENLALPNTCEETVFKIAKYFETHELYYFLYMQNYLKYF